MAAFLFLSLLPLLAAVVGWVSKRAVEAPLEQASVRASEITDRRIQAEALSQTLFSNVIFDAAPGVVDIPGQLTRSLLAQLDMLAPELDDTVARFGDTLPPDARARLAAQSFQMSSEQIREATERALLAVQQRQAAGQVIEQRGGEIANIVGRLATITASRQARQRNEEQSRTLEQINAGALQLRVIIDGLTVAESVTRLDTAATDFAATVRDTVFKVSLLSDMSLKQQLGGELGQLFELGVSGQTDSLFVSLREAATAGDALAVARRDLQVQRELLRDKLRLLEDANNRSIRDLVTRADQSLDTMRLWLMGTAVLSVLFALLVTTLYINRVLLKRFRALADATQALSEGDLSVPIESGGTDEIGTIATGLTVFRENSQRLMESERVLVQRTAEMEQANAELDKFAYVASHDLRAPLRAIHNLAGFIEEDVGDTLPAESAKHLQLILARIGRLDQLLSDLLEYSRVARVRQPLERVHLQTCIRECFDVLDTEKFVVHSHGYDGVDFTYRTPLQLVLRNLLDNACKHHDQQSGEFQIDVNKDSGVLHFVLQDDGPGIPIKFHERVFQMFQTLKPRDVVEGSGMGLAILQKTIESYGGKISIESDPEQARGTTFRFTWPVFEAHEVPEVQIESTVS